MVHSGYQKDIKNKWKLQERKTGVGKREDTEGKHKEGEWEREKDQRMNSREEGKHFVFERSGVKKKKKLQDNLLLFLIRKSETFDGSSIGVK